MRKLKNCPAIPNKNVLEGSFKVIMLDQTCRERDACQQMTLLKFPTFYRNHQQNVKVLYKRATEAKRVYEVRCREEVASNQFYHQEVARCGKNSREADKVRNVFGNLILKVT